MTHLDPVAEKLRHQLRVKLTDIMFRFIRLDDAPLSEHEFITKVMERYHAARGEPIIDPNE